MRLPTPDGASAGPGAESDAGPDAGSAVTRFAPSPTGLLHLGHAFAALTAARRGRMLLRIEDIDQTRCRPAYEDALIDDLRWLGLDWPEPVLRQSARRAAYDAALARLAAMGLLYPCRCTRGDIRAALSAPQEGAGAPRAGPDGPVYPGTCRGRSLSEAGPLEAIRLDMRRAVALAGPLEFEETGLEPGRKVIDPAALVRSVGDVVLSRPRLGTAYHLAVVIDDAHQGVTEVTRGADLFAATQIHRLLQALLALPVPRWHHHRLIRDAEGRRLAKRDDARSLRRYRDEGVGPEGIRALLGMTDAGALPVTARPG